MNQIEEILSLSLGAATLAAGVLAYGSFRPDSNFWGPTYCRAVADLQAVSLTFDDGPTAGATEPILQILQDLGVKATFFVIGQNARRWPDLVRQMDAQGHIVANHSFDHAHFGLFRGPGYWRDQVNQTDDMIAQIIGKKPAMFRPPIGIRTNFIFTAAARSGHAVINWSRRGVDGLQTDTARILRQFEGCQAGEILLLHDGIDPRIPRSMHPDRKATIAAIAPLVNRVRQRGLEVIPLDKLLGIEPYAAQEVIGTA